LKIIAGLGNPGLSFAWTRHNFGFLALDYLASTLNQEINQEGRFYLYLETRIGEYPVLLVKPQTFMNKSGIALKEVMNDWKAFLSDLVVLHDDADIPLGSLRIKRGGQAGRHKGLISIINSLQNNNFARIRLGICPQEEQTVSLTEYVLQAFAEEEYPLVEKTLDMSQKAITSILSEGMSKAMTEFNRRNYNHK